MKISQREAQRLRGQVRKFEDRYSNQNAAWIGEWPSSTVLHRILVDVETAAIVKTARALHHAVVVTMQDDKLVFWGSKL